MTTEPSAAERREAVARIIDCDIMDDKACDNLGIREPHRTVLRDTLLTKVDAILQALALPPASPSTAVGAGEVDKPLNRNDMYRFMDKLKLSEKREVAKAIGFDPSHVAGESDMDRWKRLWLWAADNDKKPASATAIRVALNPANAGVPATATKPASEDGAASREVRPLRLCPWCASDKISAETEHHGHDGVRGFVICKSCWSRGPLTGVLIAENADELAVAHVRARRVASVAWNTLATATKPASEDGEALREADLWRERWYGSEPQKGSAIVDRDGGLVAYFGGDRITHQAATMTVSAHNAIVRSLVGMDDPDAAALAPAEQPVEVAAQEAVSDAVHDALWKADAESARLREALRLIAADRFGKVNHRDTTIARRDIARAALSLDANGGGL